MIGARRRRHAAARARKLTAALSTLAFVGIGSAIEVASHSATTVGTVAVAQGAIPVSASQRSATVSAATASQSTAKAVTVTRAS
jgi:alpha-D-ribose 1-methylphosphonate 5-triphosphate diphosphatase PhnM